MRGFPCIAADKFSLIAAESDLSQQVARARLLLPPPPRGTMEPAAGAEPTKAEKKLLKKIDKLKAQKSDYLDMLEEATTTSEHAAKQLVRAAPPMAPEILNHPAAPRVTDTLPCTISKETAQQQLEASRLEVRLSRCRASPCGCVVYVCGVAMARDLPRFTPGGAGQATVRLGQAQCDFRSL